MLDLPTAASDINNLIVDQVQESIHLDYKESPAVDKTKRNEIAKDVSAFANSDGGMLIYGIVESNNLPVRMDSGVDHTQYSREWLEQVISSNINPRIDDIRIAAIQISAGRSVYAVKIPKSLRGPHQAPDKKYYKRFNFQSVPMEDYEINDVRNRRQTVTPLVSVDVEIKHGVAVFIVVSNIGTLPALDVTFDFSEKLVWLGKTEAPVLFRRGAKSLPPGKTHAYLYNTFGDAFKDGSDIPSEFDVTVSYVHPEINQRINDIFHIDLRDYDEATVVESEMYEHGRTIKESLRNLTEEVKKLNRSLETIAHIAGGTGLDLSVTTFRNLQHIVSGDAQMEKIDPHGCSHKVFKEVLGVDHTMALKLRSFFRWNEEGKKLAEVEGMTDDLVEKIKLHFSVDP